MLALCTTLSTLLFACNSSPPSQAVGRPTTTRAAAARVNVTGTIDATDQVSDGTMFTIASVSIDGSPNGGWVALHLDDHGTLGAVQGSVHIPPGASRDVTGRFSHKQPNDTRFWAAVHADDHVPNVFEYSPRARADLPVRSGADLVMQHLILTVK